MTVSRLKPAKAKNAAYLYDLPGHLIRRCHQISVALFHQECAAYNITPQQYAAMRVLADNDGVDQITLAGLAAINRTTAGELITRMEEAGYLTRKDNLKDMRVKLLFITKAGLKLISDVDAAVLRVQQKLLAPLNVAERKNFISYLARIADVNNELSRAPLRSKRELL
jgi:DNA-binding MarR family transcriptional regulator